MGVHLGVRFLHHLHLRWITRRWRLVDSDLLVAMSPRPTKQEESLMAKSKSGGTKSAKSRKAEPVEETEEEEVATTASGIERVFNRKTLQPNWKAFSEYVEEHGGPRIKPEHVGIVLTGYKYFQKSDSAVSAREEAAAAKAAAKEEREAAQEARRKEREERAAEREKARTEREAARANKASKGKKKAASASKAGTKATKATKAPAKAGTKKVAAKKKGRKAAF